MHTRDMTDEQRLSAMGIYTSLLMTLSAMSWSEIKGRSANDPFIELGICKAVELVGEYAYYMSDAAKKQYSGMGLEKIGNMRHEIVHAYGGLEMEAIYKTITNDIPRLHEELKKHNFV